MTFCLCVFIYIIFNFIPIFRYKFKPSKIYLFLVKVEHIFSDIVIESEDFH